MSSIAQAQTFNIKEPFWPIPNQKKDTKSRSSVLIYQQQSTDSKIMNEYIQSTKLMWNLWNCIDFIKKKYTIAAF